MPDTKTNVSRISQSKLPSEWSIAHRKHLEDIEPEIAVKWIAKNVSDTNDETINLIRRAFKSAFYAGAACNHSLNKSGVLTENPSKRRQGKSHGSMARCGYRGLPS